jgi:uncharacterized DUF497 family protein
VGTFSSLSGTRRWTGSIDCSIESVSPTAVFVFDDPRAIMLDRIETGEERSQTIGMAAGILLLCAAHTSRRPMDDEQIRIISARTATPQEANVQKISKKQAKELAALSRMPDHKIGLSDIPEVGEWPNAVVGKFHRPIKTPVTIRVDADVL